MTLRRLAWVPGLLATALCGGCGETKTVTAFVAIPTPMPITTPPPARRALPTMAQGVSVNRGGLVGGGGQVTGGGPTGDDAAVARIKAQYPVVPGDTTLDGDQALSYITRLTAVVPQVAVLSNLTKVGNCAMSYGVIGVRAYLTPNLSRAGAIVAVSRSQAQQLATIAAKCFISDVIGGGPGSPGGFEPCFTSYSIDDAVGGVVDRYYIFTGGTNGSWCDLVRDAHRNFNIQPL